MIGRPYFQRSKLALRIAKNIEMENLARSDSILIVDFGSQVTQLIARRVRETGVYRDIVPFQSAAAASAGDAMSLFQKPIDVTRRSFAHPPRLPASRAQRRSAGHTQGRWSRLQRPALLQEARHE